MILDFPSTLFFAVIPGVSFVEVLPQTTLPVDGAVTNNGEIDSQKTVAPSYLSLLKAFSTIKIVVWRVLVRLSVQSMRHPVTL